MMVPPFFSRLRPSAAAHKTQILHADDQHLRLELSRGRFPCRSGDLPWRARWSGCHEPSRSRPRLKKTPISSDLKAHANETHHHGHEGDRRRDSDERGYYARGYAGDRGHQRDHVRG